MSAAGADSTDLIGLALMLRCVQQSPVGIDWERQVHDHPQDVADVGGALAVAGLHQPACSEAAWRAVLRHDASMDKSGLARRYRVLSGLHGLLIAERRYEEAQRLLDTERRLPRARVWPLQIVALTAGAPQERPARAAADSLNRLAREEPGRRPPSGRWQSGHITPDAARHCAP